MRVTFTPPAGANWKVATQLYPTADPFTFTAPNLQYFMDSPTEFSDFVLSTFTVPNADGTPATFRLAAHTDASQADVDALAASCSGWCGSRRPCTASFRSTSRATTRSCSTTGRRTTATGWSIATARSSRSPGARRSRPRRAGRRALRRSRTSSFTTGTSSGSGRSASSRSTSRARTSRAVSGWRKASRSTTARCCSRAPDWAAACSRPIPFR